MRCERERPAAGNWRRYVGRVGTIVTVNDERDATGRLFHREYGVSFGGTTTWFAPDELVEVDP